MKNMDKRRRATAADCWAYTFYALAAVAALVGQVWAAAEHVPFPDQVPTWGRWLALLPIAAVVEIGGVAWSAQADARRRLGEQAYGYRALSAGIATFAIGFNWFGHLDHGRPTWVSWLFAGLSTVAYTAWLLHSGARRRDALRDDEKMADTAPVYGLVQWAREPVVTRRARGLALERGLGLFDSLRIARDELRGEARRRAIAKHVDTLIRAQHRDPVLAAIAATTYDLDELARRIEARTDYDAWADMIGRSLMPRSDQSDGRWLYHPVAPAPSRAVSSPGYADNRRPDGTLTDTGEFRLLTSPSHYSLDATDIEGRPVSPAPAGAADLPDRDEPATSDVLGEPGRDGDPGVGQPRRQPPNGPGLPAEARHWITTRLRTDNAPTGPEVAGQFGVHPSTGRRWIRTVRGELAELTT